MAVAGVSTLGVKFGYGTGTTTPSTMTTLTRINSIGEIALSVEQIDASALEDMISKYVAGRADTGGTVDVTFNVTNDTLDEWSDLIDTYNGLTGGAQMYFEVTSNYLTDAFWFIAQPAQKVSQPAMDQNGLMTATMTLTIVDYIGIATKVALS